MGSIRRDKLPTAVMLALGVLVLLVMAIVDGGMFGYVLVVFFVGLAWWSWPGRRGRHQPHGRALAEAGADDVIVYWRPG